MYLSHDRPRDDDIKKNIHAVKIQHLAVSARRLSEHPVCQIICEGPKL